MNLQCTVYRIPPTQPPHLTATILKYKDTLLHHNRLKSSHVSAAATQYGTIRLSIDSTLKRLPITLLLFTTGCNAVKY